MIVGAINSNVFVLGRLTVAAANKKYIPRPFSFIGGIRSQPAMIKYDAPFNAFILNFVLTSLYMLFGNFRALLTFVGLTQCELS